MNALSVADVEFAVDRMIRIILANEVAFCELDSAAGDGDFGMSLAIGFRAIERDWAELPRDDIAAFLKGCSLRILEHCGGASGPIWGGSFAAAARAAKGRITLDARDLAEMAAQAIATIRKRGGAKRGDKTLLDALIPAQEALSAAAASDLDVPAAMAAAAAAAAKGAEETRNMVASRGRASYVGERSLNHPDAGAFALGVICAGIAGALKERSGI